MDTTELKNYWDNKYPKNPVIYRGRSIPQKVNGQIILTNLEIDVKTMLTTNDTIIKKIIKEKNITGANNDEKMLNIQKWVVTNIKYIGDNLSEGVVEYWQFPFETLRLGTGDCEDGALLIAALAINSGIPSFRLRVVAGFVQPAPTAPQGGHGYVAYLRESDNQWVAIDWCYLQDSNTPVPLKPILKNNLVYKNMWFTFNNEYSWSQKELEFYSF
jgi:transglutaminase-like putative cysteine protease